MQQSIKTISLFVVMLLRVITLCALPHQYERFHHLLGKTQHLCVRGIAQTEDGMMWFGTEDGLYSYDGEHLQKRNMTFSHEIAEGQQDSEPSFSTLTCLAADRDSLLIGCGHGLLSFNLHTYMFRPLRYAQGEHVKGILKADGHWWVATENSIYQDGKPLKLDMGEIFSIGSDDTYLYIGGRAQVMRYDFRQKTLETMVDGLRIATCFFTSSSSGIWIGTAQNILAWSRERAVETFRYTVPIAKSFCMDKQGNLLVGTDNGLFIVEKNKTVHHVQHDARVGESLAGDAVWSLFRDRDDNIWLGTNSGISMVEAGNLMTTYTLPSITGESTGNQLFCIRRDSQGRLWMGGSNGLICVEHLGEEHQSFRWYRIDSDRYPITHNRIRSILTDGQKNVWVGGDGGLFLLNEKTAQLERYELADETNQWVYDIRKTNSGNLVVTTLDATYVVQPDSGAHQLNVLQKTSPQHLNAPQQERALLLAQYGLSDNYLSAYHDSIAGMLLLGGTDQFRILYTKKMVQMSPGTVVRVTDILVNGTRLVNHSCIAELTATFQPEERVLRFYFSDFDYAHEHPNSYCYRITGQDEWVELPATDRTLTLANLSPGTYQLYIRRANREDGHTELPPVFTFVVKAPWYATPFAKAFYLLLLVGLIGGICHFIQQRKRLKREREERAELLARAREKEKELLSDNEYLAGQLRLQLVEKSGTEGELSADEKFLLDITRLIEENMDDSALNVQTLSEKSGISTKQLYRRIKALTGMTTVAYIRDQRMKKAASLLAKGSFTVSEVMYMVGFSNASYFTRCFCDEYGVPPSEYRG